MSGASKGGLDMLTKVMGLELAPFKVKQYYLCKHFNPDLLLAVLKEMQHLEELHIHENLHFASDFDNMHFCNRQLY